MRCQDWVPGWQGWTQGPWLESTPPWVPVDRWSYVALAYRRWVKSLKMLNQLDLIEPPFRRLRP